MREAARASIGENPRLRRARSLRKARPLRALLFGVLLAANAASGQQTVYLDFVSDVDSGEHVYTASEQSAILTKIDAGYSEFDFSFTLTQPGSGLFSTLIFNADGIEGGLADAIDFRNLDKSDDAKVNVNSLLGGSIPGTSANFVGLSSTIAAHELGHIVGLRHGDSMGPIGSGISPVPGTVPYTPDYPGPTGANETTGHIMASPASVGQSVAEALGDSFFSERSSVKLAFNEAGSVVAEQALAHSTNATAQAISLSSLAVPNTLQSGAHAGTIFEVGAVAVTGELDAVGQIDIYSFSGEKDDLFNFEIISKVLSRYANTIDPEIRVFDSDGNFVPYYGSGTYNDDEFESQDSILIDVLLPDDDTYYVRINAFTSTDLGNYELFGYRFAAVPEPGTASLLGLGLMALGLRNARTRSPYRLS